MQQNLNFPPLVPFHSRKAPWLVLSTCIFPTTNVITKNPQEIAICNIHIEDGNHITCSVFEATNHGLVRCLCLSVR